MFDYQEIANACGTSLRAAEVAVQGNNMGQAIVELGTLHVALTEAFKAANELGAGLDWDQAAGNRTAARGDFQTESGGGNKGLS
jgi:hypothetical protein